LLIDGYCRCNTNETKQDINRQTRARKEPKEDTIGLECEYGDAEHKKDLGTLPCSTAPGGTILTMEVSRISQSTKQICDIIDTMGKDG